MADGVFNIALGRAVEKVADGGAVGIILLLDANETESALIDHDELNALLGAAGNTEATGGSYARKTGLTFTILLDDTNDLVDLDEEDPTWTGITGHTLTKLIFAFEESAADTGRIPFTHHDFVVTTDGTDLTAQVNSEGFYRAT